MKAKTAFFCTECGNETPKWSGQCAACGSWNSVVEQPVYAKAKPASGAGIAADKARNSPRELERVEASGEMRFSTGFSELDRVLGGGAVIGSLVLVGGSPGIGKSTLLLQICGGIKRRDGRNDTSVRDKIAACPAGSAGQDSGKTSVHALQILYITGEESERQLKMRAERLGVKSGGIFILAATEMAEINAAAQELRPDVIVVDSIQTLYDSELASSPGSVGQVKECTMSLLRLSKDGGATIFLVGHVNKEGAIAGPKVLEHMVDCVLYFEGERSYNYRILRAAKNRYGSTNEIGVFEMLDTGLSQVMNPSEMLLSGRPQATPGTVVTCVIEGTRPVLAEIQALVTPSSAAMPRRNSNGVEYNRAMMLLAVLQQRGGLRIGGCDAYVNIIGGLDTDDPGADLATVLSLASAYMDKPVRGDLAVFGEVGLTGELRQVSQVIPRLAEIARLGFGACMLPAGAKGRVQAPEGLELIHAKTVAEAISLAIQK